MENEKNAVFRNAFGGYNKNDVNEYLASMAKEFARREDEWDTERGKLERMSQDERTEKEQIAAQRDELACQLYSVQADVQQKTGELERECQITTELKASIAGLSERIHQLECELAKKNEEFAAVEEALGVQEAGCEARDDLCDRLSEKVEKIMTAAGNSAEEIVASALSRSDEIIAEAERKAEKIKCDALAQSDEITGKAKDAYKTAAADYYDEVMLFASEIRDSLNRLMLEINTKKADVDNKIEYMRLSSEPKKLKDIPLQGKEIASDDGKGSVTNITNSGAASAMDQKIETFFKNTINAINNMTRKKK